MVCFGPSGASGISGPSGLEGLPGSSGACGLPGGSGPSGGPGTDSFVSGPSGFPGMATVFGASGLGGSSGLPGAAGPSGAYDPTTPLSLTTSISPGLTITGNLTNASSQPTTIGGVLNVTSGNLNFTKWELSSLVQTYGPSTLTNFTRANPVTLVPAQGANTIVWPMWAVVVYILNTTGYTMTSGDVVQFFFPGQLGTGPSVTDIRLASFTAGGIGASGFQSSTSSFLWEPLAGLNTSSTFLGQGQLYPSGLQPNGSLSPYLNTPLQMNNMSVTPWSGGDGSMQVNLIYGVATNTP